MFKLDRVLSTTAIAMLVAASVVFPTPFTDAAQAATRVTSISVRDHRTPPVVRDRRAETIVRDHRTPKMQSKDVSNMPGGVKVTGTPHIVRPGHRR